jgi:hypothetical protein
MSKRHFDLAPVSGRTLERLSSLQRAHMLTLGFKQVVPDDPLCSLVQRGFSERARQSGSTKKVVDRVFFNGIFYLTTN